MLKRFSAFLLAICALLALLPACAPDAEPEQSSAPDTTTAAETEPPAPATLVLADNGKTDFKVIRPEEAEGYYLDTASVVYQKIKGLLSESFKLSEDWINPLEPSPEKNHEILLFNTNRAESEAAMADLNFEGFIIRVTDCKIVIVGSSPASCNEALYHFFDYIIPDHTKDGKTELPVGLEVKKEFESSPLDIAEVLKSGKTLCVDFELLFKYSGPSGFGTAQGSATDGTYAYVVMKKKEGGVETDKIAKIDMATWKVVLESEELPLDHANDMTYDPKTNHIVVTNMLGTVVSIIDADTLALVEQKSLTFGSWATGYIEETDQFTFLSWGPASGLTITDKNFNPIRSTPLADSTGYVGQGMDADNKYAYVPLSPGSATSDNIIQIYDIKTGEYLGAAHMDTKMESESMFHVGDDYYVHFNNSGSKIAIIEFYVRFE